MNRPNKWTVLLWACVVTSLIFLVYPLYVIRPFRAQGAGELRLALTVLRLRPVAMVLAIALAGWGANRYWRAVRSGWRRGLAVASAVLVAGFAALSRTNVYELMFHPVDRPEFVEAGAADLAGAQKVLAVRVGEDARAYPIRSISYHHIVNDRLGGVPLVATY